GALVAAAGALTGAALPVVDARTAGVDQRLDERLATRDAAEVVGRPQRLAGRGADGLQTALDPRAVIAGASGPLRVLHRGQLIPERLGGLALAAHLVGAGQVVAHELAGGAAGVGLGTDRTGDLLGRGAEGDTFFGGDPP